MIVERSVPGMVTLPILLSGEASLYYLTQIVFDVVLQRSIPAQIRQPIIYYYLHQE